MKIGITLGLKGKNQSIFTNGVFLNILYFQKLLNYIGHDCYLLDTSSVLNEPYDDKVNWNVKDFPIYDFGKNYKNFDILFLMGSSVPDNIINSFKNSGINKKVVQYKCGNDYVIDMERVIHQSEPENKGPSWNRAVDQVWYVPQQQYQNHEYYQIAYDLDSKNVFPVPFIWDSYFLDQQEGYKEYKPNEVKNLCSIEPNMNAVKYAMVPMMIAEEAYRRNIPFNKMNIFSGNKFLESDYSKSKIGILSKLDLVQTAKKNDGDTKIKFLKKYKITDILRTNDVIISHQWCNPLNYAYIDALYYNYPLIHNSELLKHSGYYYPDFKIKEGYKQLKYIINHHDEKDKMKRYNVNCQKTVNKFTIKNHELVECYKTLINDLVSNKRKERNYDINKNITQ